MPLTELLPAVSQLSHQDRLRLIHFLLLAVAKEEDRELETTASQAQENSLLDQLAATEAVVWSPHDGKATHTHLAPEEIHQVAVA